MEVISIYTFTPKTAAIEIVKNVATIIIVRFLMVNHYVSFTHFFQPLMVSNVMTTFATKQAAMDNTNAVTIIL